MGDPATENLTKFTKKSTNSQSRHSIMDPLLRVSQDFAEPSEF